MQPHHSFVKQLDRNWIALIGFTTSWPPQSLSSTHSQEIQSETRSQIKLPRTITVTVARFQPLFLNQCSSCWLRDIIPPLPSFLDIIVRWICWTMTKLKENLVTQEDCRCRDRFGRLFMRLIRRFFSSQRRSLTHTGRLQWSRRLNCCFQLFDCKRLLCTTIKNNRDLQFNHRLIRNSWYKKARMESKDFDYGEHV